MVLNRGNYAPQRILVVPGDVLIVTLWWGGVLLASFVQRPGKLLILYNILSCPPQQRIIQPGLPRWYSGKEFACQCRRCWFNPWVRKIRWRRRWQPTAVFLPGKFHRQRSLVGNPLQYSAWEIPWTQDPGGLQPMWSQKSY